MDYETIINNFTEIFTQYITLIIDTDECFITDDPIETMTQNFIKKCAHMFSQTINTSFNDNLLKKIFNDYFNEDTYIIIKHYLCDTQGGYLTSFERKYGEYTELNEYLQQYYLHLLIILSSKTFFEKHFDIIHNIIEKCITTPACLK